MMPSRARKAISNSGKPINAKSGIANTHIAMLMANKADSSDQANPVARHITTVVTNPVIPPMRRSHTTSAIPNLNGTKTAAIPNRTRITPSLTCSFQWWRSPPCICGPYHRCLCRGNPNRGAPVTSEGVEADISKKATQLPSAVEIRPALGRRFDVSQTSSVPDQTTSKAELVTRSIRAHRSERCSTKFSFWTRASNPARARRDRDECQLAFTNCTPKHIRQRYRSEASTIRKVPFEK